MEYTYIIYDTGTSDAKYFGTFLDLPGCCAHGNSVEECRANMQDAKNEYLQSLKEDGIEPPTPIDPALSISSESHTFSVGTQWTCSMRFGREAS